MNLNAFSDNITLHTKNLTITTDKIKLFELQGNNSVDTLMQSEDARLADERKIRKFQFVPKHDYLIIYPSNIMSKLRKYVVKIEFEAPLTTALLGYYRSSYFDKASQQKM